MPSRREAQEFNASYNPSYIPVAIITGATHGIGRAMAIALSRHLRGRVHIILVGRNRAAAEAIISALPRAEPNSNRSDQDENQGPKYEFVQCDITKMRNVHAMADDFKRRLTKVNFLVHCAGESNLRGWDDNGEGIDKMMASRYYSRWALTHDLVPLLNAAQAKGESASVLSVGGAGFGSWIDATDIGLKRSHTGFKALLQTWCYNDYMIAEFSRREPEISFTHTVPGFVVTYKWVHDHPIGKILALPLRPLFWLLSTPVEDCAEYTLYSLLACPKGGYLRNRSGELVPFYEGPDKDDIARRLWDHSMEVTVTALELEREHLAFQHMI